MNHNKPKLPMAAQEFEQETIRLAAKESELAQREKVLETQRKKTKPRMRENLYSKITLKPKTMDIIIAVTVISIVIIVALGILFGAS